MPPNTVERNAKPKGRNAKPKERDAKPKDTHAATKERNAKPKDAPRALPTPRTLVSILSDPSWPHISPGVLPPNEEHKRKRLYDLCKNIWQGSTGEVAKALKARSTFAANECTKDGRSLLHFAVGATRFSRPELDLRSLDTSGRQKSYQEPEDPVVKGMWSGSDAVVLLLITHSAKVDARDLYGLTPLHWAVANGHTSIVRILQDNNATQYIRDCYGCTPLHHAAYTGAVDTARELFDTSVRQTTRRPDIQTFPNVNAADNVRCSALHHASIRCDRAMIKLLLCNGARVSLQNEFGWTALHHAVDAGCVESVRLLLDDVMTGRETIDTVNLTDIDGHTALYYATGPIARLLLSHGADVLAKSG
jgi:ankyrin repeat protein